MLSLIKFGEQHRATLLSHLTDPSIASALPQFFAHDIDEWVECIMSDPCSRAVELDGVMIGACRIDHSISYWIHADYRGRGYATQLTNKLCQIAISLGWKQLRAEVHLLNTPSQNVLIRCGFKQTQPGSWIKYL